MATMNKGMSHALLSREEERELFDLIARGKRAGQRLAILNRRPRDDRRVLKAEVRAGKEASAKLAESRAHSQEMRNHLCAAVLCGEAAAEHLEWLGSRKPQVSRLRDELRAEVIAGERAREKFITSNLRLVASTAAKFKAVREGGEQEFEEAFADGLAGLTKAVDRFDGSKGYKFSTFGVWWILKAMEVGFASRGSGAPIDSTTYGLNNRASLRKAEERLTARLGRVPSDEELSDEMHAIAIENRERRLQRPLAPEEAARIARISPKTINMWRMKAPLSLDAPRRTKDPHGDGLIGDISLSEGSVEESALDRIGMGELRQAVANVLGTLPGDVRKVVELKFGLSGMPAIDDEEIAANLGLPITKVRSLWETARRIIADPSNAAGEAAMQLVTGRRPKLAAGRGSRITPGDRSGRKTKVSRVSA